MFKPFGKCINLIQHRQIRETESAEKVAVDEHACLKEDEKHISNFTKIHWTIKSQENIAN